MELTQYWTIIRKWWWLMVLCTLVAGASSYLGTMQMPRIYQATTTVMVGQTLEQANPTTSDLWMSEQLAQTYADMVERWPIRAGTAEALGLNFVPSAGNISARHVPGTQLLEISVRDTDPERARVLADEIAQQLILQTPSQSSEVQTRRNFVEKQLQDLETKIEETQAEIEEEQTRLDAANSARAIQQYQANIYALQQRLASYQATYASLLGTVQGGTNYISVVEPAFTPTAPISPRVTDNVLLAAAIGLALAVGGAFLIEFIDDTIKTPDDATRTTGLPVIGIIARIEGADYPDKLVTAQHPLSPTAEAYRVLRTNLQFSSVDQSLGKVLITSPGPTEGKSITLANLAVVMAQAGLRVIIVDTDLRRPVQHKIFNLPNHHGLSDVILQPSLLGTEFIQPTGITNLRLLVSGPLPPNPAELLSSKRMKSLIEKLEEQADVLLFDSPPALVVADAAILSTRADGVLLVNDAGQTRRRMAEKSVQELERVHANLLGVVMNQLPVRGQNRGYYYSYRYYYSDNGRGPRRRHRRSRSWWERLIPFLGRSSDGHGPASDRKETTPTPQLTQREPPDDDRDRSTP